MDPTELQFRADLRKFRTTGEHTTKYGAIDTMLIVGYCHTVSIETARGHRLHDWSALEKNSPFS